MSTGHCPGPAACFAPVFACYYRETTTSRNINYFNRRNILGCSILFGLVFTALALQLNFGAEVFHKDGTYKGNYLKRHKLLSCQDNHTETEFDRSLSRFENHEEIVKFENKTFLGGTWWVRDAMKSEGNETGIFWSAREGDHYLVPQNCSNKFTIFFGTVDLGEETPVHGFNVYCIPTAVILWIITTLTGLFNFKMQRNDE